MLSELQPCPFCGCHGVIMGSDEADPMRHTIKCEDCPGMADFHSSTVEQAIAAWNRRAAHAPSKVAQQEPVALTADEARAIVRAAHPGGSDHPQGVDYVRATVEYLNRRAPSDSAETRDQCFDCNAPLRQGEVCGCAETRAIQQWRYFGNAAWLDASEEEIAKRKASHVAEDMQFRTVYAAPAATRAQGAVTDAGRAAMSREQPKAEGGGNV